MQTADGKAPAAPETVALGAAELAAGHADELRHLYLERKLSTTQLGHRFGISNTTARKALLLVGVELRKRDDPICREQISKARRTTGRGKPVSRDSKNLRFGYRWARPTLRERRLEQGLSQVELARRIDGNGCGRVTNSLICQIETGRRRASPELLRALATELSAEPDELFEHDPRDRRSERARELYARLKSTPKVATVLAAEYGVVGISTAASDVVRAGGRLLPEGISTLYPEERAALADAAADLRKQDRSVPEICRELGTNPTLTFTLLEESGLPRVSPAERAQRWLWNALKVSPNMVRDRTKANAWTPQARRRWLGRLSSTKQPAAGGLPRGRPRLRVPAEKAKRAHELKRLGWGRRTIATALELTEHQVRSVLAD